MIPLRVLDLFSGIGGFSLGLERAGMETVAFCEQDGYACRVLRKHWPAVPIFEDVRTLSKTRLRKHGIEADVICGGFPCQDISTAGKGAGIDGERSGLWREYARLIREIRPLWVIAENVPALRVRGADDVLADLETMGYTAWPSVVGAYAVGADHVRNRAWIVAHSNRDRRQSPQVEGRTAHLGFGQGSSLGTSTSLRGRTAPGVRRAPDGLPHRVDRLRCLGNAVVPQIVELIGRAIASHAQAVPLSASAA